MLFNIQTIIGCAMRTIDNGTGKIKGVYFDARQWQVRYFAVDIGGLFTRNKILLPPESFTFRDRSMKRAAVPLTRAEAARSPSVKVDLTLSQATEKGAVEYPPVPGYRDTADTSGRISVVNTTFGTKVTAKEIPGARYLYDTQSLKRYLVDGSDGEIGLFRYFLVDDRTWTLRYAAVSAARALRSRKEYMLLPVQLIDSIDTEERALRVSASRDSMVRSPAYSRGSAVDLSLEQSLHAYFSRQTLPYVRWRFDRQINTIPDGRNLRIETLAPAVVRWTTDDWKTILESKTKETGRGTYLADLDTASLPLGTAVCFTFFWLQVKRWEGKDFYAGVQPTAPERIAELSGV